MPSHDLPMTKFMQGSIDDANKIYKEKKNRVSFIDLRCGRCFQYYNSDIRAARRYVGKFHVHHFHFLLSSGEVMEIYQC